jgi:hypothetical protein
MREERKTILALIALGRLTPREAERLLAASDRSREDLWILIACVAVLISQSVAQSQMQWFGTAVAEFARLCHPQQAIALASHALTGFAQLLRGMV